MIRTSIASVLAGFVLFLAGALAAPRAARWLVVGKRLAVCDLMVVPGGGAKERLSTAVDLMAGGACRRVLFTGGVPNPRISGNASFMRELGPGSIWRPSEYSESTFQDALVALAEARRGDFHRLLVVTSPYHTKRANWMFSAVFAGTGIKFGVYPSAAFYMDYDRWWASRWGRNVVVEEYAKLWLCGLFYAISVAAGSAAAA